MNRRDLLRNAAMGAAAAGVGPNTARATAVPPDPVPMSAPITSGYMRPSDVLGPGTAPADPFAWLPQEIIEQVHELEKSRPTREIIYGTPFDALKSVKAVAKECWMRAELKKKQDERERINDRIVHILTLAGVDPSMIRLRVNKKLTAYALESLGF